MQSLRAPAPADPLRRLGAAVRGRVIGPDDPSSDQARTVFYGGIDRRPAAIVRVADAADVARVVELGDLKAMHIDLKQQTAWAETGLTTGAYTAAAIQHGLAAGFGDTGSVGIGGITLGGGIGSWSASTA